MDAEGNYVLVLLAAGTYDLVFAGYDGAVVAVGYNEYGQCDVGGWDLN
jgi:hypothetical protein